MELSVIARVDMFSWDGTTPLATVGQSTSKISLGRYIDAAQLESESDDPRKHSDDSGGLFRRSTIAELC